VHLERPAPAPKPAFCVKPGGPDADAAFGVGETPVGAHASDSQDAVKVSAVAGRDESRLRVAALFAVAAACAAAIGLAGALRPATAVGTAWAGALPARAVPAFEACPVPSRHRQAFVDASLDTGLPVALLVALGEVESGMRETAVSPAGARGLLQVMPTTAAELRLDPTDPPSNVLAGARYLRQMLHRFGSTDLALAAYNAGPNAVEAAGGPPYPSVAEYVSHVTARWQSLAGCT
jgi:soluble lytic murein transglycosylase-like protein